MKAPRRVWRIVDPLVWGLGLFLLARIDPVVHWLPVLAVLRGPLGLALVVGTAILALAALLPPIPVPRAGPLVLGASAAVVFLGMGLRYASSLRVSGDEPHYLLMAQSLWQESDLDLRDNLAREDFRAYTPGPVAPHYGTPRADGRPYPAHSPGLPVVLAPLFGMGGRLACVAFLCLCAAALSGVVHALALRVTGQAEAALAAWGACLGAPVFAYAFHVYTEVPAALALALGLYLLLGPPTLGAAIAAALCASVLPWLHLKMIPVSVALGAIAVLRLRGRSRAAFVAISLLAGLGYLAYYRLVFGVATPLAIYGGGLPEGEGGSPLRALVGLFLDRSFGLVPHAPVFLLALAGLPRLRLREAWPHMLVGLAVVVPVVAWRMWWGGQCPPARFLVPAVPLLAVALAVRSGPEERGLARWRWALLAVGLALSVYSAWNPGDLLLLNRGDRPTRLWTSLSGERDVGLYLPSLVSKDPAETRVAVVWLAAIGVLLALEHAARNREAVDRLFRGPGLALTLLVGVGLSVDLWARAG